LGEVVAVARRIAGSATKHYDRVTDEFYRPSDPEIQRYLAAASDWISRYNTSPPSQRKSLLLDKLGFVGDGVEVRPPFFCDYGFNIKLGAGALINFNCVILDVVEVLIGDRPQIGPGVHIYAADHPRDEAVRKVGLELGRRVRIGRDVWIGGNAVILPGVSVGDNAIIGAGAVVTKDVPTGATAVGNPAGIL
jgi:maltose O-acetyltransferase